MEELAMTETECPVCMDNMTTPIILCIRGHNICGCCKKKLLKCPICKGNFNSRNRALEEVATKISALCKNAMNNNNNHQSAFDILDRYNTKKTISEIIGLIVVSELKCNVCENYSSFPIFFCTNGHSTCHKCEKCTKCGGTKTDGRNYALERIVKALEYPCPYKKFGCSFILTIQQAMHENICEYKPRRCPLSDVETTKCPWFGTCEELKNHLVSSHVACKVSEVSAFVLQFRYSSNTVTFTMGKIFVISIVIKNGAVFYRINVVRSESDVLKYKCIHMFLVDGQIITTVVMNPSPKWHEFQGGIFVDRMNLEVSLYVSIIGA